MRDRVSGIQARRQKAEKLAHEGQLEAARRIYADICRRDRTDTQALWMLGVIDAKRGDFKAAESSFRKLVTLCPDAAESYFSLGRALAAQGRSEEGLNACMKSIELRPGYAEAHQFAGNILFGQGRLDAAAERYRAAINAQPDCVECHLNLGIVLRSLGNYPRAKACFENTIRLRPEATEPYLNMAELYADQREFDSAATCYRELLQRQPEEIEALLGLANAESMLGKTKEAVAICEQVLRITPGNEEATAVKASILESAGNFEQAWEILQPCVDSESCHVNIALVFAAISRSLDKSDQAIALMERLLDSSDLFEQQQVKLHFSLGKLYDSLGRYKLAFKHYEAGNSLCRVPFDSLAYTRHVDRIMEACSRDILAQLPRASIHSDQPIFIVGMPRSGTSLVEQIMSCHPQVFGAGELPEINRLILELTAGSSLDYPELLCELSPKTLDKLAGKYLEKVGKIAGDAVRVTDKMPENILHLGLIDLLFPAARVVYVTRDARDTCLSCYFQDFSSNQPYTNDLSALGSVCRQVGRLADHWRRVVRLPIFELEYEALVEQPESTIRSLLEFCGLQWDERCLHFHKQQRITTTVSYDQVRQPLYRKSIGRWRHYQQYLAPLFAALDATPEHE